MKYLECILCGTPISWENFSVFGMIVANNIGGACNKCRPNYKQRPYLCKAWATEETFNSAINDGTDYPWATYQEYQGVVKRFME